MNAFDPSLEAVVCGAAPRIADERGVLTRVIADGAFAAPAFADAPRQVLHSGTAKRGTLRGLHAQAAPYSEAKVLVAITGRMFWVVVDLRMSSATFGRWQGNELSPDGANALYVPAGFAHGCLSLTDDVNLLILADKDYSPAHGLGIAWDDPEIAIEWPHDGMKLLISAEHAAFAPFAAFRERYGGLQ
jgi:dTDP-4-dehydrorhamnose 3,5-epimerase